MTHLYIELNTGLTEEVNSSIISKLYELAISGDLDNTSDLKGRLHTTICKDTHYNYLNSNFDELYISADTLSITFEDPFVEHLVAYYIGDGTNVLLSDILTFITSGRFFGDAYSNPHTGKQHRWIQYYTDFIQVVSFDELSLFEGITGIFHKAFENCINMTSIQLPTTVTTIGRMAFKNTLKLTSIDLSNVKYIYQDAFRLSGITGVVNLPEIVNFVETSDSAFTGDGYQFQGCTKITEVNLGPNLLHIETNNIFADCSNLETITGLSNITAVPNNFVKSCSKLTSLDIDWSKMTTIKESSFYGCSAMPFGELSIPNLVNVESSAFMNCLGLTKFTGLSNITSIPIEMFRGCSNLTTVDIDWTNITNIGNNAFYNTKISGSIDLSNATNIGGGSFYGTKITSVTLPTNLTSIWGATFSLCSELLTINLGNVTSIAYDAFWGCSKLNNIDLSKVVTLGGNTFIDCTSLTSVDLSSIIDGNGSFSGCTALTTVVMGNANTTRIPNFNNCTSLSLFTVNFGQVSEIPSKFLKNCSLVTSTIDIPNTVTNILYDAFWGCGVSTFIIRSTTPPTLGSNAFNDNNGIIYVPDESVNSYKTASGWSSYASRIKGISELPLS